MNSELIYIYTDGACRGNPGPGGWGAVLICGEYRKEIKGGSLLSTNNIMELTAVIKSLELLKNKSIIEIITDSTYVKNGITEWIKKWKKNGWKNANKKPVKNKDLWLKLNDLCQKNTIIWKWVKGHSNNRYNNLADELATKAIIN